MVHYQWVSYKKVFPFQNCLKPPPPQSWRFSLCIVLYHRSFFNATFICGLAAVISEKDFLALCNSWRLLCSLDVFKEEILNLPRK